MKIVVYMGHPAHFHLFKHAIAILKQNHHTIRIVCRTKDVLTELLDEKGWQYENIISNGTNNTFSRASALLTKFYRLMKICSQFNPDILVGTSEVIPWVGKALDIPSLVVNEDDAEAVPYFAKLAYPLASYILTPEGVSAGKWSRKQITYTGNHELAYLHPHYFQPDPDVLSRYSLLGKKYFIIRLAHLNAHHDSQNHGISSKVAWNLYRLLKPHGPVLITAERPLESYLETLRTHIPAHEMHHLLYYANLYIGDSQTMAAEAAVMGTPFVRYNNFVGKLHYLRRLEQTFGLGIGILEGNENKLYQTVTDLVSQRNLKTEWQKRSERFLTDNIDVTVFIIKVLYHIHYGLSLDAAAAIKRKDISLTDRELEFDTVLS
ncbi:DUF354 domain-containing protein [candidate division KSB1 bacterium]|nr:DUF354 domain-containing protein [candidate division KSB1 bacterium]